MKTDAFRISFSYFVCNLYINMPLWNNTIHFEFNSLPGQLKGDPYFLSCYYFLFLSYVLIAISTIIVTASDF